MKRAVNMRLGIGIVLVSVFAISSAARANIIWSVSGPSVGDAEAAQQSFLGKIQSGLGVTEGFENFTAGVQQTSFSTSVGTFTGSGAATGSSCNEGDFNCGQGLGIVGTALMASSQSNQSGKENDFWGRFPLAEAPDNNQYLDSLDHATVNFQVKKGYNALGFFLTDPNDAGGKLDIFVDGSDSMVSMNFTDILGGKQNNKGAFYLSFFSTIGDISALTFTKNNTSDGIGFDGITIARVPEPGTIALLALGLLGLALSRKRKKA